MTKDNEKFINGDGMSVNSFSMKCFISLGRRLLHENKSLRKQAAHKLITEGHDPKVLKNFINGQKLETKVTLEDLAEFMRITGLPVEMVFKIGDHMIDKK
jgi:hypothetical protein